MDRVGNEGLFSPARCVGGLLLLAAGASIPVLLGCGGGDEPAPRPTAHAAEHSTGTYWGGGGSSAGPAASLGGGGVAGMPIRGHGGGAVGDAMRRRRAEREAAMRERLGPVRLTEDGRELWPLYEDAVRRMERETADEDDDCERTLAAGEILADDVGGSSRAAGARARRACRGMDETAARCVIPEYAEQHDEECAPVLARGNRARRVIMADEPEPDAIDRVMAPGRGSARRAGYDTRNDDAPPRPADVLPDMGVPLGDGDGTAPY